MRRRFQASLRTEGIGHGFVGEECCDDRRTMARKYGHIIDACVPPRKGKWQEAKIVCLRLLSANLPLVGRANEVRSKYAERFAEDDVEGNNLNESYTDARSAANSLEHDSRDKRTVDAAWAVVMAAFPNVGERSLRRSLRMQFFLQGNARSSGGNQTHRMRQNWLLKSFLYATSSATHLANRP